MARCLNQVGPLSPPPMTKTTFSDSDSVPPYSPSSLSGNGFNNVAKPCSTIFVIGPPSTRGQKGESGIFVLIDGVGDVSIPRFGFKTPLQAAKVPNLDAIASAGVNGLMDTVEVGLGCGSDTAHLSLLGYDPRVYYRGRGAFESMGAGLAMLPGDIACKAVPHNAHCYFVVLYSNFANLDEKTGIVISWRADRHFEEQGPILCAALDGMKLQSFPEYEVRVRLSGNISGTDPLKDNRLLLQAEGLDGTDDVNELSKEISRILVAQPLNAKRAAEGKNIADLVYLRGCAPGATGDYRTLLTSKANATAKALFL
ncbi:hypothetical protein DVH24_032114 [Malus domestica]|uniref:Metalloenzyme domain-containing protein n=1 Tax=Malus domestica TaxID=3750 RepID=A0A498J536_MALDO|nr:hypothetical protein DVH24_032114 [Malus domestica]